ncbi:hypothetical protein GOV07_01815 [Candidatus Woesearchaeota archaeon]|nr:hypothetical protein [Candidatus Woesearchaeota archaeon]
MRIQLLLTITALALLLVACGGKELAPEPEPMPEPPSEVPLAADTIDEETLTEIDGLVTELDELDAELDFSDLDALDEELDFS